MNRNGNKIYRYSICHGVASETQEMTRSQMINALKNAIDSNTPLLRVGV
jgi:ribosomal protein S7